MDKREFKDRIFNELAKVSTALGNPKRLEIIDLLAQGEKTVEKIALETNSSIANTSKHLQVLKAGQLVEVKRNKNFIIYKLSNDKVALMWSLLREFGAERIAEVDKVVRDFRNGRINLVSLTIDELLERMENGEVVLLDVRPEEEFRSGHIARALSIPYDQLASRLGEIPKDKEIIAYCRGPFCVFADDASEFLLKNHYNAKRLKEGYSDWKLKGLPVGIDV
jgi:rhodanese-related sulfurtransferase